jgi:hypothetical protein
VDLEGTIVVERGTVRTVFELLGAHADLVVSLASYPRGLEGDERKAS